MKLTPIERFFLLLAASDISFKEIEIALKQLRSVSPREVAHRIEHLRVSVKEASRRDESVATENETEANADLRNLPIAIANVLLQDADLSAREAARRLLKVMRSRRLLVGNVFEFRAKESFDRWIRRSLKELSRRDALVMYREALRIRDDLRGESTPAWSLS